MLPAQTKRDVCEAAAAFGERATVVREAVGEGGAVCHMSQGHGAAEATCDAALRCMIASTAFCVHATHDACPLARVYLPPCIFTSD